jgi:hypothetical protein
MILGGNGQKPNEIVMRDPTKPRHRSRGRGGRV